MQLVACGAVSLSYLNDLSAGYSHRGKLASTIAQVVGGTDTSGWLLTSLTISFVVFAPPVSHAADYWGRRWLLILLALAGMIGCIITSRAQSVRGTFLPKLP
jgi:MFS family permease